MRIETPDMTDTDRLADLWVALAEDQRAYGSYLLPEENRDTIRESVARHIVTGGLLVARVDSDGESADSDEGGAVEGDDAEGDDADEGDVDRIVGFVMFGPETGSYEQDVDKGVIQNIYVVPEHRGAGIGETLLAAAEDAMRDDGMKTVVLDVMASNERAQEFYRRHGYREHRVTMAKEGVGDTDADVDENDMHSREH